MTKLPPLISCQELYQRLQQDHLVIVDCSWYLPQSGRDGEQEYQAAHIPGAVFYDLEAGSEPNNPLPHTLPSAAQFSADMQRLGVSNASAVVVYDGSDEQFSAARLWWQLRVYGHDVDSIALLDGGFPAWQALGLPTSTELSEPAAGNFSARLHPELLASLEQMQAYSSDGSCSIVDARGSARFLGTAPEPRPGVAAGHIPGSVNVPYSSLSANGKLLQTDQLRQAFAAQGVDFASPISCTCGSGVTACVLAFALHLLGYQSRVYDGSWSEWGSHPDTPKIIPS